MPAAASASFERYPSKHSTNEPALQSASPASGNHAQAIVALAKAGDRGCFSKLFLYYTPRIKGYLRGLGTPAVVAEELAQETLLAVWRKAASFDPDRSSPSTWIFTIARNIHIDRHRHASRREQLRGYYPEELPVATPADDLQITVRMRTIDDALNRLSAEHAVVIRLSFFEQKSHSEIAAELRIPLGTVKYRLRHGLNLLRVALYDME